VKIPARNVTYWIQSRPARRFAALRRAAACDVAVIGAGITGLTAALLLQREGLKVVVLEARRIAEATTGGTTAHLTELLDTPTETLVKDFGREGARAAYASTRAALDRIAKLVDAERIDCGFRRVPALWWTESAEGVDNLRAEHDALRQVGVATSLVMDPALGFPAKAALRAENQARFHVRDYLVPLAEAFVKRGGALHEDTRVTDVEDGEPCRVVTPKGVVTCGQVVVATHVPIKAFWVQPKLAQYRSYVIAARFEGDVPDALLWDDDDPYHYVRLQETPTGPLVIVGGEDHKVGQERDTWSRYDALAQWASKRFRLKSVTHRWSRQVVETVDGLPYIGRPGKSERVFVGTGYSGTGMTFGTLAAMMATDAVMERESPWSSLYAYNRVHALAAAKDLVTENVDFPVHMVKDRLKGAEGDAYADVPRGEGRLLSVDGKRLAVYRDGRGKVSACSAVCTHMGCIVQWNEAEKTWDCPCHGSRFDTAGEVLDGPAVAPLERAE
jgi:glycine/D-amino acid oxidase-like deaminating enzyme/nitrite reductase/ring-hydroxylating ferredoxin subunit